MRHWAFKQLVEEMSLRFEQRKLKCQGQVNQDIYCGDASIWMAVCCEAMKSYVIKWNVEIAALEGVQVSD